jgi:hypothetical protein
MTWELLAVYILSLIGFVGWWWTHRKLCDEQRLHKQATAALERERIRLAVCGVAAFGGEVSSCVEEYKSASLSDVLALRKQFEQLNGDEFDSRNWWRRAAVAYEREALDCEQRIQQILAERNDFRDERDALRSALDIERATLNQAIAQRDGLRRKSKAARRKQAERN